ncbi:MAG: FAD binding domain-containing protein [Burkholderiales bacterium]
MKAADFDYFNAGSIAEVCGILSERGADARIIAGGQSLVPMMAMRLTKPAVLIDINDVAELQGIDYSDGRLEIRAATRQCDIEISSTVRAHCPILLKALHFVGHSQTRNRGTLGGSMVHADPSAELPLVSVLLDADVMVTNGSTIDAIPATEFFLAPMVTALTPEQCVVAVSFPVWPGRVGGGFHEVSPRVGDFAIASAAAQIELDDAGRCIRAAIAVGGAAATPLRVEPVEDALISQTLSGDTISAAAALAAEVIDPDNDLHASAEYRRRVACLLIERALADAHHEALGNGAAQ